VAEVRGSRTHRTTVPRRPTSFEGQESHRTLLTSETVIIGIMATKYEILKKRRVNRAKKKSRLKRRAQEHFQARKGSTQS
jgi:hypothetical protein